MTEFETQLLKTLKGIQRELVIINTKEEDREFQRNIFELNDDLDIMRTHLVDINHPLHDDLMKAYKDKMSEVNRKIFAGGVDL